MTEKKTFVLVRRMLTLMALFAFTLAALSGCAAKQEKSADAVFFPPPPNEPRVQYLYSFGSSVDVGVKAGMSLITVAGGAEKTEYYIKKPYGIKYFKGKVYVCDLQGPEVYVVDLRNKSFLPLKGNTGYGKLKRPINLSHDAEGNLFVADNNRNEVLMYDAEGKFLRTYGKGLLEKIADVAADARNVYILDLKGNDIKIVSRESGRLVGTIGATEGDLQGLSMPTNFALTPKGILYASNIGTANVMKLDRDGHIVETFGKRGDGFGEFARPKGVAVDEQENIYVIDAGHMNVQLFSRDYRLLMFFGNPPLPAGVMNLPAGVAVTTEDLDFFQQFAEPGFELERIIFVTNQSGPDQVAIYGMGKMKNGSYSAQ